MQNLKYKKIILIGKKYASSSQKSSADKKVKVAGPSTLSFKLYNPILQMDISIYGQRMKILF